MPYLPIDPADVGRTYDSVIRVNSQSGKGGVAYLLETEYGIVMPRRLQVEFSAVVQAHADAHGTEVSAHDIWQLFAATYLTPDQPVRYRQHQQVQQGAHEALRLTVDVDGQTRILSGEGNGPIDAAVHAMRQLGIDVQVRSYEERSVAASAAAGEAQACAIVELVVQGHECFGVGMDANIVTASIKALVSALNRSGDMWRMHATTEKVA